MTDVYSRLCEPFDHTFTDVRGGVQLEYITGEQVATRLNEVLGPGGWSFSVLKHDINTEADEAWALGEIVAEIEDRRVVRQQFGSQKLKRSRSTGVPLDIGFDLKGAATDAMKKCASLLGVGLYLSKKEQPARPGPKAAATGAQASPSRPTSNGSSASREAAAPGSTEAPKLTLRQRYEVLLDKASQAGIDVRPWQLGASATNGELKEKGTELVGEIEKRQAQTGAS